MLAVEVFQLIFRPLAFLNPSIGIGFNTLSVIFPVLPLAYVFIPVCIGFGALSMRLVVFPFSDVLVSISIRIGTKTIIENS